MNLNLNSKHGRNSQLCQQAQALPAHTWRATFQLYPRATVRWCTYSNVSTFHTTTEPATKKSFWSSVLVWVAVYSHVSKKFVKPLFIYLFIYIEISRPYHLLLEKSLRKKWGDLRRKEKKKLVVCIKDKKCFSKKKKKQVVFES